MIRARLVVAFVLITLIPLIGVGIVTSLISYHNGRQQTIDRLESVAARKELALQGWVHSLGQEVQFASQTDYSPKFISTALRLANEGKVYPWYNNLLRRRLDLLIEGSSHIEELFLIDLGGHVVVSTDSAREGRLYDEPEDFRRALEGLYIRLPFYQEGEARQDDGLPAVITLAPHLGDDGQVVGVIGGRSGVEPILSILAEETGLGESGKAYLVDANQNLLQDTQELSRGAGSVILKTLGVETAIRQEVHTSGMYAGYGGATVVGSTRWMPDLDAALSVEQDTSEAFRAVYTAIGINLIIALAAVAAAVTASIFMARSIADPIASLSSTASQVARGNLGQVVKVERDDEIGALARSFNSMTVQLRDLINSLERRVAERTGALQQANVALERKALQLEISASVGRQVTSILEIDVLLTRVVDLIKEAFGYYHVQVFLLDREADELVFRAGSRPLSAEHRRLEMGMRSINTRAAGTGRPVLVNDVSQDSTYLFDQQLPDTRSELVVPMLLGDKVLGTLDVHHACINAFSEEDVQVISSLGDQIAVAIQNAHLYEQSKELAVLAERTRLARELHDSVTQSLYSVVLLTEGWRRQLQAAGNNAQIDIHLGRIREISQGALKEMRLLIHELRSPALEQEGLIGALRKRMDAIENQVGIAARVVIDDFVDLPPSMEEGLYRIAQEALNNALKHAQATRTTVRISSQNSAVVLEISDDGVGFDPQNVEPKGGMGLASMRERTRQLGGELTIRSQAGAGTTVTARAPINTKT